MHEVQALRVYVGAKLGQRYVVQDPYDMAATFAESSRATPMFFVLFPGVDPTVWVETLGRKLGFTVDNGTALMIELQSLMQLSLLPGRLGPPAHGTQGAAE